MAGGIDKIREIAERVAQSSGLELVDVELLGGGKARVLRVFIDKPGGVTHEDCANFSREAGTIFDVEDAVPGSQYTLEVSSPGLDRKLSKPEEFQRFVGSLVKIDDSRSGEWESAFRRKAEGIQRWPVQPGTDAAQAVEEARSG